MVVKQSYPMRRTLSLVLLLETTATAWSAQPTNERDAAVSMAPFLVEDTKAGVFCVGVVDAEPPRIWFLMEDENGVATDGLKKGKRPPTDPRMTLHLAPLRSFDLQAGDEVVTIRGQPIADMTGKEARQLLLATWLPQPVAVQVRRTGSKQLHDATFVLHSAVRSGTKVPRPQPEAVKAKSKNYAR
jgi:hypothetical protein